MTIRAREPSGSRMTARVRAATAADCWTMRSTSAALSALPAKGPIR